MNFLKISGLVVFLLIATAVTIRAADPRDEAVKLVQSAVTYYRTNGFEKSLEEFPRTNGLFNKGEMYIFVYDLNATMLAHPNPKLVGQNTLDLPDASGKMFRQEIVKKALKDGRGWTDYKYQNPKSKEVEDKSTYFEKVDDIIICCGIYRK